MRRGGWREARCLPAGGVFGVGTLQWRIGRESGLGECLRQVMAHQMAQGEPIAQAGAQVMHTQPPDGTDGAHPRKQPHWWRCIRRSLVGGAREPQRAVRASGSLARARNLPFHIGDGRKARHERVGDEIPQDIERRLTVPFYEELGTRLDLGGARSRARQLDAGEQPVRCHPPHRELGVVDLCGNQGRVGQDRADESSTVRSAGPAPHLLKARVGGHSRGACERRLRVGLVGLHAARREVDKTAQPHAVAQVGRQALDGKVVLVQCCLLMPEDHTEGGEVLVDVSDSAGEEGARELERHLARRLDGRRRAEEARIGAEEGGILGLVEQEDDAKHAAYDHLVLRLSHMGGWGAGVRGACRSSDACRSLRGRQGDGRARREVNRRGERGAAPTAT